MDLTAEERGASPVLAIIVSVLVVAVIIGVITFVYFQKKTPTTTSDTSAAKTTETPLTELEAGGKLSKELSTTISDLSTELDAITEDITGGEDEVPSDL